MLPKGAQVASLVKHGRSHEIITCNKYIGEERSPQGQFTHSAACKNLIFPIKRRAKEQKGILRNSVLKVKPTNIEILYCISS